MTDKRPDPKDLGYAGALAELDEILVALDNDDADVDRLAEQVSRASELLRFCKERITGARAEVSQIVAELNNEETEQLFD